VDNQDDEDLNMAIKFQFVRLATAQTAGFLCPFNWSVLLEVAGRRSAETTSNVGQLNQPVVEESRIRPVTVQTAHCFIRLRQHLNI
jgi:hypothetical protein